MEYPVDRLAARGRHSTTSRLEPYWPEIDGLRTVAVISVFAFHLDPRLLRGGFVGVDIFFVISGYLITTLLLNDIESGSFSILRFYQRRVARIAPASLLVVAITMIAGSFLYSAQDFASLGANGIAASLSLINMKLLFQGSYFEISPDAQPLMHYWSLAVEEQFYVLFPILLYGAMKWTRIPLLILLILCMTSFISCVLVTPHAPTAAFYLLATRAWELLAGSNLAIVKKNYMQLSEKGSSLCVAMGLIFVLCSLTLIQNDGFPGWIASLPVAGSTLMLAGIGNARGVVQRFLANSTMVFVGKRSYSLYLWHWPIFSFIDYRFFLSSPEAVLAAKIIVTVAATVISYRFVERPLRLRLNAPQRRRAAFSAFFVATTILGIAGYVIRSTYYLSAEPDNVARGGISVNPGGLGWVVVIGDSQGAMYGYELASIARAVGFRLNVLSAAAGNELPGEPNTLWPSVCQFLATGKPDVVILAQAWSSKLGEGGSRHFEDAVASLLEKVDHIIVITQPPKPLPDATRHAILAGARPPFFEDPSAKESRVRADATIRKLQNERLKVLDVADLFLNSDGSIRLIGLDARVTFQDGEHLSDAGTALVRPRLERVLRGALHLPITPLKTPPKHFETTKQSGNE